MSDINLTTNVTFSAGIIVKNAHVGLYFRGPCKWNEPAEICERPNATQVGRKIGPIVYAAV